MYLVCGSILRYTHQRPSIRWNARQRHEERTYAPAPEADNGAVTILSTHMPRFGSWKKVFGTVVAIEVALATWWLVERVPLTEGRGSRAKRRALAHADFSGDQNNDRAASDGTDSAQHPRVQ